jgi:putative PIN family toxin of toxin-antitoxin system
MGSDSRWRVFVDTSVLVAGTLSRTGASAAILDLGEAEEIRIVLSRQVLVEADRVLAMKAPRCLAHFRSFIKNLAPLMADDPKTAEVKAALKVIDADDAAILAAAKNENPDFLVSLDAKHFLAKAVKQLVPFLVVSPGQFLEAFRKNWE